MLLKWKKKISDVNWGLLKYFEVKIFNEILVFLLIKKYY